MIAIETHFIGPNSTRGSRYVATTLNGDRLVTNCNYALNETENHERAAEALREKLGGGEHNEMVGGRTRRGMAWVFVEPSPSHPTQ